MTSTAPEQTITMQKETKEPKAPAKPRHRGIPVDWVAGHGPVSAPLAMATTATAVASLGSWTGLPAALPLAVGAVGAVAHGGVQGLRQRLSRPTIVTRATAWLLASGWTSAVIATNPTTWSPTGWWVAAGALAASTIGVGSALHHAEVQEEAAEEERLSQEAEAAAKELETADRELAKQWMALIRHVTRQQGVRWTGGFERRPDGSGFGIEVELPLGYTLATLQGHASTLAQAARLPVGCLVRVTGAGVQGHAILDIDLRDTSAEVQTYPQDYSPLSVLTGIPWGLSRVGELVYVYLREACGLILGPPGSGKTTLLDAVLAGMLRCVDVVVWGIDLGKRGGAFLDWLQTFTSGESTRPAIDWVAGTPEEAELMLAAAETISDARIPAYRHLAIQQDLRGLLPVSAQLPEIIIVVDEGVEALASTSRDPLMVSIRERIKRIMRTDREAGVRTILTATDGNLASIGDTVIKKHASVRAALTATDQDGAGVSKLFGTVRGLDPRQLRAKGSGVIGAGGEGGFAPQPFRTWKTSPSFAREVCLATDRIRPRLDQVSVQAAGAAYASRWSAERTPWLAEQTSGSAPAGTAPGSAPTAGGSVRQAPKLFSRPAGTAGVTPEERTEMEREMELFLKSLDPPAAPTDSTGEDGKPVLRRSLNLHSRGGQQAPRPEPAAGDADWFAAALAVLAAAGPDTWLSTSQVLERLPKDVAVTRPALSGALAKAARESRIRTRGAGGHVAYSTNAE
ncbi:hypothetical protein ACIRD3_39690 [Kitasatospora sp. NPDC093550]|uniref:hypothetical protein n=1 Tax=Kitasatospora sp. NPDC093550 TaxID=3364089 RepID=UPI00382EFEB0